MPAAGIFKHSQTDKYNKSTERRLRRRDVDMEERCREMEFNMKGGEVDERVESVKMFRYLGRPIDQMDDG